MQQQQSNRSLNTVVLVGRSGKDPELKYFESGAAKASFSMAVDRPGSRENRQTDWFNIDAWGRTAEVVAEYLKKGRQVAVSGRLSVRNYKDDAGNDREFLSVVANDVRLLGSRRDNEGGGSYSSQPGGYGGNQAPF